MAWTCATGRTSGKGRPLKTDLDHPGPRPGRTARLGAAALCLSLSPCGRPDPADGGGADPALPGHAPAARSPSGCSRPCAGPPPPSASWSGWRAGARSVRSWSCAAPSSSASPARPTAEFETAARLHPRRPAGPGRLLRLLPGRRGRRQRTCPTRSRRRSRRSAWPASWRSRPRSAGTSSPPGSASGSPCWWTRSKRTQVIARSYADAPEIDGVVIIPGAWELDPGDFIEVEVTDSGDHDLWARAGGGLSRLQIDPGLGQAAGCAPPKKGPDAVRRGRDVSDRARGDRP